MRPRCDLWKKCLVLSVLRPSGTGRHARPGGVLRLFQVTLLTTTVVSGLA